MRTYHTHSFFNTFKEIGLQKGDIVFIHSSLMAFGSPIDIPIRSLPQKIYGILISIIGEEGTIAVPTFNFDFCKGIPFNRQITPSKSMGVFSEFIRKLPDSRRSAHPMQSVAVVGNLSDKIVKNDTPSAFVQNGVFDKLLNWNAKVVLLGSNFESISFIHWAEEKHLVPYRYWKTFKGKYTDHGKIRIREYKMFVRSLHPVPIINKNSIENILINQGKLLQATVGRGKIISFLAKDFTNIAEKAIEKNPYYFVSNHPKYLQE